jgi:hypothetical protein
MSQHDMNDVMPHIHEQATLAVEEELNLIIEKLCHVKGESVFHK